jgi:RND family efflux transporter MFP subunit
MSSLLQWPSAHLTGAVVSLALMACVAGCGSRERENRAEEAVDVGKRAGGVVTLWTDSTELFMEYPTLVVDRPGKFLIHLTVLSDFASLESGQITLRFEPRDGRDGFSIVQEAPRSPGIYGLSPNFPRQGLWDLTITIEGPQLRDVISVPDLRVYASHAAAIDVAAGPKSGISLLKEQQWQTPGFRTSFASIGTIDQSFDASGEIVPAANRYAEVAAPIGGLIEVAGLEASPVPGQRVEKGQVLATLTPTLGESGSSFAAARRAMREAQQEFERATRLFDVEAIPERRLLEAEIRLDAAREAIAGLTLGGRLPPGGKLPLRSPIDGVVASRTVTPGSRVEAGARLFTILDASIVWLRVDVPARRAPLLSEDSGASFQIEGRSRIDRVARTLSIGSMIDPVSRTVPVLYEVENPDASIKVGSNVRVSVRSGREESGVVLPSSAILDESGRPVAYVQVQGETFERRDLILGGKDAERVLVRSGIRPGERVVTGAAYQVRLASLSTSVPAHGHEH